MGHHINTDFALIATFLAVGIGALLITIAHIRLSDLKEDVTNEKLESAESLTIWGYILGWISAGLTLLLSFFYFTHGSLFNQEWPHLILFILIIGLAVASGILALIAAGDINSSPAKDNDNGAKAFLYWGAGLMGLGLLIILFTGIWRVAYNGDPANKCKLDYPNKEISKDCLIKGTTANRTCYQKGECPMPPKAQENQHFPQWVDEPKSPSQQQLVNNQGAVVPVAVYKQVSVAPPSPVYRQTYHQSPTGETKAIVHSVAGFQ